MSQHMRILNPSNDQSKRRRACTHQPGTSTTIPSTDSVWECLSLSQTYRYFPHKNRHYNTSPIVENEIYYASCLLLLGGFIKSSFRKICIIILVKLSELGFYVYHALSLHLLDSNSGI